MPDPFKWLPEPTQRPALLIFFLLSAVLLFGMHSLDRTLITNTAPRGIVSFELAGNIERVNQILDEWEPNGRVYAALSLGLDYLFLIVYAIFISLACVRIARNLTSKAGFLAICGIVLAWAQFLAALLDAIENFALIQLILDSPRPCWAVAARWCATVKFSIVGAGLAYILFGILITFTLKCIDHRKKV
jgi:hypothetical protein